MSEILQTRVTIEETLNPHFIPKVLKDLGRCELPENIS